MKKLMLVLVVFMLGMSFNPQVSLAVGACYMDCEIDGCTEGVFWSERITNIGLIRYIKFCS